MKRTFKHLSLVLQIDTGSFKVVMRLIFSHQAEDQMDGFARGKCGGLQLWRLVEVSLF